MSRAHIFEKSIDVPVEIAQEMAAVGIIPMQPGLPVGSWSILGGQRFVITGFATPAEFHDAYVGVMNEHPPDFSHNSWFYKVSTD